MGSDSSHQVGGPSANKANPFLAPDADPGIANCVGFRLAAIETATAYLSLEGLHLNEVMEAMAGRGRPLTLHFSAAPSQETPFTFPPGL